MCGCEEHNMLIVNQGHLRSGHTKSCGCLHRESIIKTNKNRHKENRYDLSGEYGIIWSHNTNEEIYFDLDVANQVLQHGWSIGSKGYPVANIDGKVILMHIFLGYKNYDHHNRNKLDNRRKNFVICTQQENSWNRSIPSNNTSGVIGVGWHKSVCRWIARISYNNTNINIGSFINKQDAIKARLKAEVKYYGEFAPQRHLFEQYGINTKQNDLKER
jgi:hypothetical protein